MSMQAAGSQNLSNGGVANHLASEFCADDVISDDDDIVEEEPQSRTGVFSKFRSVCQNVFQSLLGPKQSQRGQEKTGDNATRIIRRRSRQTLVPPGMMRKPSESALMGRTDSDSFQVGGLVNNNNGNAAPMANGLNGRPSSSNLAAQAASSHAMEIGSRLAMPTKRSHVDAPLPTASTPFKGDVAAQSFSAPWSALKQRRLEESVVRPADTTMTIASARPAPVIETTSLQTMREPDRYSSMTLPHRPISRDFGSALSSETSALTTPLGAKRRVSLFESKTMTPHFNAEKMEAVPYAVDRFAARSPLVNVSLCRPQSPLAPRVVRLDVAGKSSPHSPLVRAPLLSVPSVNPTAQRLARAYQQLTSASRPQMTPIDPARVHLIDPAQFFSRPKSEAVAPEVTSKIEPVSVRSFEPQKSQPQKPAFSFAAPSVVSESKVVGNGPVPSGKFLLTAPAVLVDANSGSSNSIWTCSDCDIANSTSNDYCFSCGRSKVSSSSEFKPTILAVDQPDVAIKRQRQSIAGPVSISLTSGGFDGQQKPVQSVALPATTSASSAQVVSITAESHRPIGGPAATSTPFVMSVNSGASKKVDEYATTTKVPAPSGGVVGQWRCNNCLYMNDFKAISCTRCSRSSSATAVNGIANDSAASSTPAVGASSRLKRRATLDGGWVCGCQHMNPRSATACDLCNAPKPLATVPSSSVVPTVAASSVSLKATEAAALNGVSFPSASLAPISEKAEIKLPMPVVVSDTSATVRLSTATATTTSLSAPIPTPAPIFGSGTGAVDKSPLKSTTSSTSGAATTATATVSTPLVSTGFAAQVSAKPEQPSASGGFGAQFASKPGQWICDVCMIRNDKDKVKCAACESPNPNAPADAAKPATEIPKFGMLAGGSVPNGSGFSFGSNATSTKPAVSAPTIGFGVTAPATTTAATTVPTMSGFKFGASGLPSLSAPPNVTPFSSAATTTAPTSFTFGAPASTVSSSSSAAAAPSFAFGSLTKPAVTSAPETTAAAAPGGFAFSFGSTTQAPITTAAVTSTHSTPFGIAPSSTSAATASLFGMTSPTVTTSAPVTATPLPSFGAFGAPSQAGTATSTTGLFGSTVAQPFGTSSAAAPTSTAATTFTFGSTTTSATNTSTGFTFGAPVSTTASAAPAAFSFGSAAASSTAAPGGGFAFGSTAPASTAPSSGFSFGQPASVSSAPSTAPTAAFSFGSSAPQAPASSATFSFGSAPAAVSTASAQTNGPSSLFAFGSSAPSTGGPTATTQPAFGQSSQAPQSFSFGSMSQPAASTTGTATGSVAAPGFNFASSVPSFGSGASFAANGPTQNNGSNGSASVGGFKFDTNVSGFNFSSGNTGSSAPAPAPSPAQPSGFVFSGSGFSPAPPGGSDGPMLFSSGAAVGNRPKATAARKLKVAGRK